MGVSCEADLEIDQTVEEIKSAQPTITSISPTTAAVNSTVTIEGTFLNFATKAFIGDIEAQITSRITGQRLEIQVPNNALPGIVRIVTEQEKEASSTEQLSITYPEPTFTGTLPTEGFVNSTITIQGNALTSITDVKFGTVSGVIEFQEEQALVVRIPNNPGNVDITLTYLSSNGPVTQTIATGFEVILPQPTIGGFPSVFNRDQEVIVIGQDMNLITSGTVKREDANGMVLEEGDITFTTQSPTEVRFMVPSNILTGYVDVTLNFDGGGVITREGTPYINGQFAQIYEFDTTGIDVMAAESGRNPQPIRSINGNVEQPPFPGTQYFASELIQVTGSTQIRPRMHETAAEATADILDAGNYGDNPVLHFWMHTENTEPNLNIYIGGTGSANRRLFGDYQDVGPNNNIDLDLSQWNLYAVRVKNFIPDVNSTAGTFELRIARGSDTGGPAGSGSKFFNFDWFIVTDAVLTEFGAIDITDDFRPAG
ncbi:hypothetical protein BST86_06115 [Nonlabens agnitus]|uniref:IPT/TIG domain-containing protein n=1 Tax=Nonlabens agnitus TaxID=870484 RepID=A0A2S9WTA4_9FLAO|nr:hypothetical protein BST86_06115 [Nonlabens agnitus]